MYLQYTFIRCFSKSFTGYIFLNFTLQIVLTIHFHILLSKLTFDVIKQRFVYLFVCGWSSSMFQIYYISTLLNFPELPKTHSSSSHSSPLKRQHLIESSASTSLLGLVETTPANRTISTNNLSTKNYTLSLVFTMPNKTR